MRHVLIAEDDDSLRGHLARALDRAGYAVTAVADGADAVPVLEEGGVDLLVTDIVMPGVDGIELARIAGRRCPEAEVVFITGFAGVALRANEAAPKAKLLSKPFHLNDLVLEADRLFARGLFAEAP